MQRLLIAALLALATSAHAQRREIDPAQYASFVQPVSVSAGELIASGLTPTDYVAGPNWTADVYVIKARAGEVVTAQLRSEIPGVEVHVHHAKSHTGKAIVEGPAQAEPLRFVAPKDGDYFVAVHAKGPQRFGAYLLALGSAAGAPPFEDAPKLIRTAQAAAAPALPANVPPFTQPAECAIEKVDQDALEACKSALAGVLEAQPGNHLARLRLADTNYHLDDDAGVAAAINGVRSQVTPQEFEALLAAQHDFEMVGAPDCRMIVHKTNVELQWRGGCANGVAEGVGALIYYDNAHNGWAHQATMKGGVIGSGGTAWGVQQRLDGGFDYFRQPDGARARTVQEAQIPANFRPLVEEMKQVIPTRMTKTIVTGDIRADFNKNASGWPYWCLGYRATGKEQHRLTAKTPGRQAWIAIQAGAGGCNELSWVPSFVANGASKLAPAGSDIVSLDVVLSPGLYKIVVAGGPNPGPMTYTREQMPVGGGQVIAAGAPEPPPQGPGGTASTFKAKADRTYRTGEVIKDCPTCPEMVVLPAGSFMLGSPATEEGRQGAEGPRKQVTFKQAFAIGKYEVTFDEWNACVAEGACAAKADNGWGQGRRPVINVDYNDARAYIGWLSKKTGYLYFLPSETEWEYAARAGTDTPWYTGDGIITDDANILNAFGRTVPVGGFPANAWGLHDMAGNVYEYVQDCYEVGYFETPNDGRAKYATGGTCVGVMRGGDYLSEPAAARSAARMQAQAPGPRQGFRVTRLLD